MSPDRTLARAPRPPAAGRWSLRSTWGELAFAGVWLAVVSGVAIAVPYDPQRAYDSIALVLLTNPAAAFFRNVHYWAGQLFLVLTLAHAWDHLSRWTESKVPRRMWWRVTASVPLAVFVMLSGFMLKGDAESQQALRIVTTLIAQVPFVGRLISVAVFGTESSRQVLYVHHVATATLLLWLFVAEHARATWPRLVAIVEALAPVGLVSLLVSPALHDGLDPVVKGPWYFLGLQETLHWTARPVLLVYGGLALVATVAALPRLPDRAARACKRGLVGVVVVYAALTAVGLGFRGANWTWSPPGQPGGTRGSGLIVHGLSAWWPASAEAIVRTQVPVVLGRREGCLFCHDGMAGLSRAHGAEAVGCASCHAGNPFSLDRATAHAGIVLVPGNLASAARTCGTPSCHPTQVERVNGSLMTSMAGIVAVDRAVFGDRDADPAARHVMMLGREGADGHLRQLCASCHLGAAKVALGPVGETSRGGGCNACHLVYNAEARAALARYERARLERDDRSTTATVKVHPNVTIGIERGSCFGCHSRSGRISTSYEGWMEVAETDAAKPPAVSSGHRSRILEDGRTFAFVSADAHARTMDCVDCHTSREVMGDGEAHARAHEALRVACTDCHIAPPGEAVPRPSVVPFERLDTESRRIAELRQRAGAGERFLATANGGQPLMNTAIDANGTPSLTAKSSGKRLPMKPPAPACLRGDGHARLSCISCHAVWAPRCPQCHTAFDAAGAAVDLLDGRVTKGAWMETGSGFAAVPPTLGVSGISGSNDRRGVVDTFIPGMVMTLDRSQLAGAGRGTTFRRLYARSFSHTIGKSRSCESCHADPVALGYGEGSLRYEREGQFGRWRFAPKAAPGPDGLPADAWVGFLQERAAGASSRTDVRPFTVEEQKRILAVGACLTCHEATADGTGLQSCARKAPGTPSGTSTTRGAPIRSCAPMPPFRDALAHAPKQCLLPRWSE